MEWWNSTKAIIAVMGGWLGAFIGPCDGLLYTLVAFMIADYISGVMCGISRKELSSEIGFRGIFRKLLILILVGVGNLLDVQILGGAAVLRTAVICFYLANEGLSIVENAAELGLPIPAKLRAVLKQLHDKADENDVKEKPQV